MPRTARVSVGDVIYHVINRGNGRAKVFHKDQDYLAFLNMIALACERVRMRVLGLCLMPNHFHLVLWPHDDGDLSRWMQWLMTSHVRRYHAHYRSSGHVWQGRFKSFPIQADEHLLSVLRYIDRNALRARLAQKAQDWPWNSLALRGGRIRQRSEELKLPRLAALPIDLPRNWLELVNRPQTDAEIQALRQSIMRGRPFGDPAWQRKTAAKLGLESSLNPRGRPRKSEAVKK